MALQFTLKADDQISPNANSAASSLAKLDAAIKQESRALASLEGQMRSLQKAGSIDLETHRKLSGAISGQRDKIAGLTQSMIKAGGAGFVDTAPKVSALAGTLDKLGASIGGLATPSGALGQTLGKLGPYGIAAAAGVAAIGTAAMATAGAVGFLYSKLLEMGVAASEAKGDTARSLELLYGSEKAAQHTYRVIESLTQDIAISQGRALELSDSLIKAGMMNGDRMVAAIAAIGKAEAARKGAGQVLEGVITRSQQSRMFGISRAELMQVGLSYRELAKEISRGTGMAVGEAELRLRTGGVRLREGLDALNRVIDTKMGDIAQKKLMTVGAQSTRLRENFAKLFEDVNTSGLARMLQSLANTLDQSSFAGSTLRSLLSKMFDEMSAAAERVAPYIQTFFEGAILMALKLYNALYPVRQAIKRLFGGDEKENVKSFEDTLIGMADAVGKGFTIAAVAIAFMIDNAGALAKVIESLISVVPVIGPAFSTAKSTIQALTASMGAGNDKTQGSGKSVADGVAAGIRQGTPNVEAAMTEMASKGTAAFDRKMQIKSPSKVMQLRGYYIDQGVAKGVNDNAEAPANAAASMADKATQRVDVKLDKPHSIADSARRGGGDDTRGPGGGDSNVIQVTFGPNSVVVHGSLGDRATRQQTQDQLTELLADVCEKINDLRATGST